jgi:hypothetical protein
MAERCYAECNLCLETQISSNAECCYAECRYAKCRGALGNCRLCMR